MHKFVFFNNFFVQFTPDMLDTLYKYAKLQYECGDYMSSSVRDYCILEENREAIEINEFLGSNKSPLILCFQVLLQYYRQLVPQHDLKNYLNALYGKLASEIMLMVGRRNP